MCTIAQALEDRGMQKGMQKGSIGMLYSLVKEHMLTPETAARKLNVPLNELGRIFKEYGFDSEYND